MNPALRDRLSSADSIGVKDDLTEDLTTDMAEPPTPPPSSVSPPPKRPAVQPIAVGSTLRGRYVLEELLAQGGTALVFRARDLRRQAQTGLDQFVALKILRPELSHNPIAVERLKREFDHELALSHPNIVRSLDFESDADRWFLTQELLEGESLADLLRRQTPENPSAKQCQDILQACADALMFAHDYGIVHGDFKPGNVFITRKGQVRVLDFGAAISGSIDPETHAPAATFRYASPEVLEKQRPERRDDIFSFACVAYELIGRRHPFERRSALEARAPNFLLPRLWGLTDRQWFTLESALSFRRDDRPASLRLLADELFSAPLLPTLFPIPEELPSIRIPARDPLPPSMPEFEERLVASRTSSNESAPASTSILRLIAALATVALVAIVAYSRFDQNRQQQRTSEVSTQVAVPAPGVPAVPKAVPAAAPVPSHSPSSVRPRVGVGGGTAAAVAEPAESPVPAAPTQASITFDTNSLSVSESAGAVVLTLRRDHLLEGRSRVHWRSIPDTAQPGQDYVVDAYGVASFAEGHDQRAIFIPLVHDSIVEPTEQFTVEIYEPSGNTRIGPVRRVTVTVQDDD